MKALALLLLLAAPQGDDKDVTKINLLPPGRGNPRNSEGDFLQLKDGIVMFVYTRFTGGTSDDAAAELVARFSGDGGRTWTPKDLPVVANEGGLNVMSVSLVRLAEDEIGLFYLRKNASDDCRMMMRRSVDEGRTWGEPTLCMADAGYFVVNNDRVVRLKGGRLVIPSSLRTLPDGKGPFPGVAVTFLSDDAGKTWRRAKGELRGPAHSKSGLQEPLVVELKDGRLMMLCRTDQGCQYRSYSGDGGETWSPAEPSDIRSPLSPASVARIPSTGDLLLVWNDHSDVDETRRGKRTPFRVAISRDEGRTWEKAKTLDDDPEGWFCYTAIEFVGGRVLLAHCAGDAKVGRLNRTRMTSFDISWLYR
jgi:hypothetical protein